jgi:hypothetical protein
MIIYGEAHFQPESVAFIEERIRTAAASCTGSIVLAHELAGDGVYTPLRARRELENCGEGNVCDPLINKDIFALAVELDIMLVGIDLPAVEIEAFKGDLPRQFAAREKRMIEVLRRLPINTRRRTIAVVGDAHLRYTTTKELGGPSKIHLAVQRGTLTAEIVRAEKKWREVE